MKACIGEINIIKHEPSHQQFTTAIGAWDYIEKKKFRGDIGFKNAPIKEREKFARWCMGNKCENNHQTYTAT